MHYLISVGAVDEHREYKNTIWLYKRIRKLFSENTYTDKGVVLCYFDYDKPPYKKLLVTNLADKAIRIEDGKL